MHKHLSLLLPFIFLLSTEAALAAQVVDLSHQKRDTKRMAAPLRTDGKNTVAVVKDFLGNTHVRSQQVHGGIPIWNYHVIEHQGKTGVSYSGYYVNNIQADLSLSKAVDKKPSEALAHVRELYLKGQPAADQLAEGGQVKTYIFLDDDTLAHKVYHIRLSADSAQGNSPSVPTYLVDTQTLAVYKAWDSLAHAAVGSGPGGNEITGRYEYGPGKEFPAFDVKLTPKYCTMDSKDVKTVDFKHSGSGAQAYRYTCNQQTGQYYHDEGTVNGAYGVINDAHFFGHQIVNMYREWYGMDPLPIQLVMGVHYGDNFANAMWNPYTNMMYFGDGDNVWMYPLVVLDVAAHEVAHGVTQFSSDLVYEYQSGGLNESFSDISAQAAEYYVYGVNDWKIGSLIMKTGEPLRYMDDPTLDGMSIGHASDYTDDLDVHLSSGVFNKAFYNLATTPGWDVQKAYTVFYVANLTVWQPEETFAGAGCGLIHTTQYLIEAGLDDLSLPDVVAALDDVGVYYDSATDSCHI